MGGSTWMMNPIPNCGDAIPGSEHYYNRTCKFPQFPPPCEQCWGDSDETIHGNQGLHHQAVLPTIIDRIQIPEGLAAGEYVLGWRWDCEQSQQVWASCSDITIVRKDDILV